MFDYNWAKLSKSFSMIKLLLQLHSIKLNMIHQRIIGMYIVLFTTFIYLKFDFFGFFNISLSPIIYTPNSIIMRYEYYSRFSDPYVFESNRQTC